MTWVTRWRSRLGQWTKARRSRVQSWMVSLEFFIDIILPAALCPWGSTQPLTEMSTRNISWGIKAAGAYGWQPYHLHVRIVLKSGSLTLLEPSGPVQACNGNDIIGDICNLMSASGSSLFLYLVFVIPYRKNPDSFRSVFGNSSSFLTFWSYVRVSFRTKPLHSQNIMQSFLNVT